MTAAPGGQEPGRWRPPLRRAQGDIGYYTQPVLLSGPWHWLIVLYFYLGGISGASLLLSAVARLFGGPRARGIARAGSLVSLACILPTPGLLVLDLGRRSRFHHMLRVFKPLSPMNTGAWALSVHGVAAGLGAWHELASLDVLPGVLGSVGKRIPARAVDVATVPVSLYFSGYTGTLLATTAIPVWARTPLLGPLFMASAAATGTAAVDGALALAGRPGPGLEAARVAALATEGALDVAYEKALGEVAGRPLKEGRAGRWFRAHKVIGVAVPMVIASLPWRRSRGARLVSAAAVLGGAFCLRAAVVEAGHQSAADPEAVLGSDG